MFRKMRNYYVKFTLDDRGSDYYVEVPEDQLVLKDGLPKGINGTNWFTEGQMISMLLSGEFTYTFDVPKDVLDAFKYIFAANPIMMRKKGSH